MLRKPKGPTVGEFGMSALLGPALATGNVALIQKMLQVLQGIEKNTADFAVVGA